MTGVAPAIHTDGAVSCGTRVWRFRGRLQLTVVVKAVFAIVPDGVATLAGPGEIVPEDRHLGGHPIRSVEEASDLAPYRTRCDVLFVGHAHAAGAAAGAVRLGLSRDGQRLLDKTIHVYGDRGAAGAPQPFTSMPIVYERALRRMDGANPIGTETPNLADPVDPQRPAGFGPISCLWPVRRRLLEALDRKSLDGPIAEIPEGLSWEYFQAAPPDQQLDPLRGGEWLVLDGLHPTRSRVQTRLPAARGAARVALRDHGPGSPVELVCDTLAIDGDRQLFSLSWRGHCEVTEGEAALPAQLVLAALEVPGFPADWARIQGTSALAAAVAPAHQKVDERTVSLDPTPHAAGASLPFGPAAPLPISPPSGAGTPWGPQPIRPALVAAPGEMTLAPQPSPIRHKSKTIALPDASHALLASLPAVPFAMPHREPAPVPAAPEISGAPWSNVPVQPPPRPDEEPVTAELEPLPPVPAVVAPLRTEPPPPLVPPPPPPADPWARPPEVTPREPAPQKRAAPPPAFERPAAGAVKSSFYSRFKK